MYATSLGTGGTLPIHAKFFPCDKFLDLNPSFEYEYFKKEIENYER